MRRMQGGLNPRLHADRDAKIRPLLFFVTARSVDIGAVALLAGIRAAEWLLADRAYDTGWVSKETAEKGVRPCIPDRASRGKAVRNTKRRNRRRIRIDGMSGYPKDRRRIATCCDRCPKAFLSAAVLATTVMFPL